MDRITQARLQGVVDLINRMTNSPPAPYAKMPDGTHRACPGNYHLSGAFGGWKMERVSNERGGTSDVLNSGYVSKRVLYDLLHAYRAGLDAAQRK